MIQLKDCLIATAGLVMLIPAVARLNALDADSILAERRRPRALRP